MRAVARGWVIQPGPSWVPGANCPALAAMDSGAFAAQLGLHTVVPGRVFSGAAHEIEAVVSDFRSRGYTVETTGDGFRVGKKGEPPIELFARDEPNAAGEHKAPTTKNGSKSNPSAEDPGAAERHGSASVHDSTREHGEHQVGAPTKNRLPASIEDVRARKAAGETWSNKDVRDSYNAKNAEIAGYGVPRREVDTFL